MIATARQQPSHDWTSEQGEELAWRLGSVVARLGIRPGVIVAKGGIPPWLRCVPDCRRPALTRSGRLSAGCRYGAFRPRRGGCPTSSSPGNVGDEGTLLEVVDLLLVDRHNPGGSSRPEGPVQEPDMPVVPARQTCSIGYQSIARPISVIA